MVRVVEAIRLSLAVRRACCERMFDVEIKRSAVQMLHAEVVFVARRNRAQEFQFHGVVRKRRFPEVRGHFVQRFARESSFLLQVHVTFSVNRQKQWNAAIVFAELEFWPHDDL
jgi:hypothetical protein